MDILYHYTDFIAFNGILRDGELRVNNVLNMNDATEMELFMTGLFRAVTQRLEQEEEKNKARQLNRLFAEVKEKYFDYSAYAACFSEYRDDASQWERYAFRGRGVCIGFRKDLMEKMTGGAVSLHKVFYQEHIEFHPLVQVLYQLIMKNEDISEQNPELDEVLREAWKKSASFKHPSFSSEHEVRLVVMPFEEPDFAIRPCYHVARERIKKYYPLNLREMCAQAGTSMEEWITEIIIGPESTQSLPILQDYLRDISLPLLAEKVCDSECPLRSKP